MAPQQGSKHARPADCTQLDDSTPVPHSHQCLRVKCTPRPALPPPAAEAHPTAVPHRTQFGAGRWWWILVGLATGLAVGLTKCALRLDSFPTFIQELRSMHVEPLSGLKTGLVALLGLLGGLPMGPEAGLGE